MIRSKETTLRAKSTRAAPAKYIDKMIDSPISKLKFAEPNEGLAVIL
jgi:hypothetical protein